MQETTLFAATVRENITFGKSGAAESKFIAAAKAAQAHDFILPNARRLRQPVGEKGVTLSGGQKPATGDRPVDRSGPAHPDP